MGWYPKADKPKRKYRAAKFDSQKFYQSKYWKDIRAQVLIDEPLCRPCRIENRLEEATQVDHIIPIRLRGSPDNRKNLQPICDHCHGKKSGKEAQIK